MTSRYWSQCKIGFIGGGNMASAIGAGLIKKGVLKAEKIWVSGKTDRTFDFWDKLGVHTTLSNKEVIENCTIIFLAMKPQMLDDAMSSIDGPYSPKDRIFVSLLVGVTLDVLQSKLKSIVANPRIIRAMPNTPLMVGEGITVFCSYEQNEGDEFVIKTLFSHNGVCEIVPESLMNAIGALSGSGPAYAYLMTEALADGAVRMGVPRAMATKFAAQVLVGAGKMILETGRHPGTLKDEVCSPGGSTITGIHALEQGAVRASLMNAVEAAANRSEEFASAQKK